MADSGITKRALAHSLKSLLAEHPFEKISVSDICDGCDMNRKSFYYHFHDKYELVNWIFNSEFVRTVNDEIRRSPWEFLRAMCDYLYENRTFYRKALRIEGQNSFAEYFKLAVADTVSQMISTSHVDCDSSSREFYVRFYSNLLLCSLSSWLSDKDCVVPDEYVKRLRDCALIAAGIV